MKRAKIIILAVIILSGIIFSCEDFFLDPEPIGHLNPDDPEYTGTVTGRPEIKMSSGTTEINTGDTFELAGTTEVYDTQSFTFTIENLSEDTALTLSGSPLVAVSGTDAGMFAVSTHPSPSVAAGGSTTFILDFTPSSAGAKTCILTIASDDSNESSFVINISATAVFTPLGTALADDFAASGASIISDSYLAPRTASDTTITVGGDITVGSGATLTIYEGVTLDMGTHQLIVDGCLCVEGSDAQRVKFTGSDWGGILVNGTADINGAAFTGYNSGAGYGLRASGGDVTVTNSRFHQDGTSYGIQLATPGSGAEFIFMNNIFIDLGGTGNQPGIEVRSSVVNPVTMVVSYNTFIGKSTNGTAFDISESNNSTYTIENNIFAGSSAANVYTTAIQIDSSSPVVATFHNVYDDLISLWTGQAPTLLDDLALNGFDSSVIFNNISSNDLRLQQSTEYPNLAQANDITELVGCLTNGHGNEVGAYGNGGYPPDWNE